MFLCPYVGLLIFVVVVVVILFLKPKSLNQKGTETAASCCVHITDLPVYAVRETGGIGQYGKSKLFY